MNEKKAAQVSTDTTATGRTRTSPNAAERMRLHRKRQRDGMQYVRIQLHVSDIDSLVRIGALKEEQRRDPEWLQTAILTVLYRAQEDSE